MIMTKQDFEKIIRPLVLLPKNQTHLLKGAILSNFKKWQEEQLKDI